MLHIEKVSAAFHAGEIPAREIASIAIVIITIYIPNNTNQPQKTKNTKTQNVAQNTKTQKRKTPHKNTKRQTQNAKTQERKTQNTQRKNTKTQTQKHRGAKAKPPSQTTSTNGDILDGTTWGRFQMSHRWG